MELVQKNPEQARKLEPMTLELKCALLLNVVERFREVDAEMQAQSMAILLKVAKHSLPLKMAEIAEELGLSQSTVSRNVAYLGDWNRHREKGHQLVEAYEDPSERRRKLVRLTPKGKRFVTSLANIVTESIPKDYLQYVQQFVAQGGNVGDGINETT